MNAKRRRGETGGEGGGGPEAGIKTLTTVELLLCGVGIQNRLNAFLQVQYTTLQQ